MRVYNQLFTEICKAYNQHKKVSGDQRPAATAPKDGIELSAQAELYREAIRTLREQPANEGNKLAQLREAVKTGTYEASGEEIAERIWRESIFDRQV